MMLYFTSHYGNPSSSHIFGNEPQRASDHAHRQLLTSLCVQAAPNTDDNADTADTADNDTLTPTPIDVIWFTECGTESDNLAIALAVQTSKHRDLKNNMHIVTCNVEHPVVELYLKHLEEEGVVTFTY
jgi:cysteine desulfurase